VATSTVRFAIIVAFVIAGAVLIAQFPEGSTSALDGNASRSPSPSESPSQNGGGQANNGGGQANNGGGGQETEPPPVKGVRVAVYNGTFESGLAGNVADALVSEFEYKIHREGADIWVLDAPDKPLEQTTVYFVTQDDKPAAEALAQGFFEKLEVKIAPLDDTADVPPRVQVAVYLGTDYANS
jgi:hypothetical protein